MGLIGVVQPLQAFKLVGEVIALADVSESGLKSLHLKHRYGPFFPGLA